MKHSLIWSTQPVYISSTFSDMNAERDVLRKFIFPEIEKRLRERRVRLVPVDLRWGVDMEGEEELTQKNSWCLK